MIHEGEIKTHFKMFYSIKEQIDKDAIFEKHIQDPNNWKEYMIQEKDSDTKSHIRVDLKLDGLTPGSHTVFKWFEAALLDKKDDYKLEMNTDKNKLSFHLREDKDAWYYRSFFLRFHLPFYHQLLINEIEKIAKDRQNWKRFAGTWYECDLKGLEITNKDVYPIKSSVELMLEKYGFRGGHIEILGVSTQPKMFWKEGKEEEVVLAYQNVCIIS